MPEALPAVTRPSALKVGFSLASFSRVVSRRTCSSVVMTVFSLLPWTVMGMISSSNLPASMAAAARCWERRAY